MRALIYSELLRLKVVTVRALELNLLALLLVRLVVPSLLISANGVFILTLIYALAATMMGMQYANALTQASERAFLIHRPVKLSTISNSVVLAGMLSVFVAFLLPFLLVVGLLLAWQGTVTWAHMAILSISVVVCFCGYLAGLVKQHCGALVGWLICALPLLVFAFGGTDTFVLMGLFVVLFVVLLVLYQRLFGLIESKPSRLLALPLIVVLFFGLSAFMALSWQMFIITFDNKYHNNWVDYYPKGSIAQVKSLDIQPKLRALFTLADVSLPKNNCANADYTSIELLPKRVQNFPFQQSFTVNHFGPDGKKVAVYMPDDLSLRDDVLTVSFPAALTTQHQAQVLPMAIKLRAQGTKVTSVNVIHTPKQSLIAVLYKPQVLSEQGLPFFELITLKQNQQNRQIVGRKVVELTFSWPEVYRLRNYFISPLLAALNTTLIDNNPNQLAASLRPGDTGTVLWLMGTLSVLSLLVTWRIGRIIGLPQRQQQGWLFVNALTGICGLLTFVMIYFVQIKNKPALFDSS
jgi:hypothetical protein